MINIYIIRHGETNWNRDGLHQGFSDIPLNERGLSQAEACAKALAKKPCHRMIVSDLIRARQTADAILQYHDVPVTYTAGLREINFGDWEGLTYEEIAEKWPGKMEQVYTDPVGLEIPNGDTVQMVQDRAWAAVKDVLKDMNDGETLFVVCHGGTVRTLLCAITGIPLDYLWKLGQGNTAINWALYDEDGSPYNVIRLLNDTSHTDVSYGSYTKDGVELKGDM